MSLRHFLGGKNMRLKIQDKAKDFKGKKHENQNSFLLKKEITKEIQLFPPYQGQNQDQAPIHWNSNKEKKKNMLEIASTPKMLARIWGFWAQFALQKKNLTKIIKPSQITELSCCVCKSWYEWFRGNIFPWMLFENTITESQNVV